jgi:AcrR family transcriptional regulator
VDIEAVFFRWESAKSLTDSPRFDINQSNVCLVPQEKGMLNHSGMKRAEEIERVAARLFALNGYHSTTMREIAREMEMNPSTLYHYFKSKEELLFKLMNDAVDDALVTLEGICGEEIQAEEKLKRVLRFYTRYYAGDQERLLLLVQEMNSLDDRYRPALIEKQKRYVELITSILEDLAAQGKIKALDPKVVAFAFFGTVHYTPKWYRNDGPVDLDRLADIFVEIFTDGLFR